jgi:hypothetical protein
MPGQDRTGPAGMGPMTGRGLGSCGSGLRRGFGCGFGRGVGRRFTTQTPQLTKEQEKKILEAELAEIEAEKDEVSKRLKELK